MTLTHFARGNRSFRHGDYEEAISAYREAIERHPELHHYHLNLAEALHRAGREREAASARERADELRLGAHFSGNALKRTRPSKDSTDQLAYDPQGKKPLRKEGWQDDPAVKPMLEAIPPAEEELRKSYAESALVDMPDTFVLYRIIGNDLYPRHAKGQSRENVRFILENEPELPDCEKRWVLNRIFDAGERQAIIELLEQHGQPYLEIPFEAEVFAQIAWDYSACPEPGFLSSSRIFELGSEQRDRALTAVYRNKNLYLMNNNGARNAALDDGRSRAMWVLPWDGNCFVTASAWEATRSAVRSVPYLPYFAVPMQRITDNAELLRDDFIPCPVEEPQLLFRCDARERFSENHPYGRRPKVELFWRLGIPGKWDRWKDDPWDQPRSELSLDAGAWGVAGWVARLASGKAHLEASTTESFKNRGLERQKAIRAAINHVTREVSAQPDPIGLTNYRFEAIEALRTEYQEQGESGPQAELLRTLLQNAADALERDPESPIDKPEPGPSGDLHDYYHPAPYWWPNPDTKDGLPYVRRDGERVPGTRMYEPESHRYDRTRLQRLFDDSTTLGLAAFVTDDHRYATHAVRWLDRWFIDPASRMNPHLTYAQVRWGRNGNRGFQTGVIEMKDLYYTLDVVRLLQSIGVLTREQLDRMRAWFSEYLGWLLISDQGKKEAQARNNHGTYYDLQVAAVAAFLDQHDIVYATLARAEERMPLQIAPDGVQHEEMTRTNTAHYCCFTLQGWLNLLNLATRFDGTLVKRAANPNHPLCKAVEWLMKNADGPWAHPQMEPFDRERFIPIYTMARSQKINCICDNGRDNLDLGAKDIFHPHDGIPRFWKLCCQRTCTSSLDSWWTSGRLPQRSLRDSGSVTCKDSEADVGNHNAEAIARDVFFIASFDRSSFRDRFVGMSFTDEAVIIGDSGFMEWMHEHPQDSDFLSMADGRFAAVRYLNDKLLARTDAMAQETIYLYQCNEIWAFSNSLLHLVEKLVAYGVQLEFYAPTVLSMCISNQSMWGGQPLSHKSVIADIDILDASEYVQVDLFADGSSRLRVRRLRSFVAEELSYETLLEDVAIRTQSRLRALVDAGFPLNVDVSGGWDTRLSLALVLGANLPENMVSFNTSYQKEQDLVIANAIQEALLWGQWSVPKSNKNLGPNDTVRQWKLACAGVYLPAYFFGRHLPNDQVKVNGAAFTDRSYRAKSVDNRAAKIGQNFPHHQYTEQMVSDFLESFERMDIDRNDPKAMDLHYINFRGRFHYGLNWYRALRNPIYSPLMDARIFGLAWAHGVDFFCNETWRADLTNMVCPQLLEFPVHTGTGKEDDSRLDSLRNRKRRVRISDKPYWTATLKRYGSKKSYIEECDAKPNQEAGDDGASGALLDVLESDFDEGVHRLKGLAPFIPREILEKGKKSVGGCKVGNALAPLSLVVGLGELAKSVRVPSGRGGDSSGGNDAIGQLLSDQS